MHLPQVVLSIAAAALMAQAPPAQEVQPAEVVSGVVAAPQEQAPPPLVPRWRETGTPYDPNQLLQPYVIAVPKSRQAPTSGLIASPPEYAPARGMLFWYASSQWPAFVCDMVVALTKDPYDEIAYVVVTSSSQQTHATTLFTNSGANMSKVQFIIEPGNAVWIRDYGPHFIWQDGALGIVDSHYYPTRPLDNFIPTLLGDDHFIMPTYDMGLYYSGGNFLAGPDRTAFVSSLVNLDNPASGGFDPDFIAELYNVYQGIDTLHVMPQLPASVDATGHIDMWMYLVDEDTAIVSQFIPGSNSTAIQITNDGSDYLKDLGYQTFRPPAWNAMQSGYNTHYTYTNAARVNDRIFISTYGEGDPDYLDEDAEALALWTEAAGPDVTIVPIDSYPIIWAAGAIHCTVMQVPRYTDPIPAVHVISPAGGELLVTETSHTISWVASDTDNVAIPQIDLYYSIDDGDTYEFIDSTTDAGFYHWTVPNAPTTLARVKVVATAADSDQAEAVSTAVFQILQGAHTTYDFAAGAGTDKWGWGYQTSSWYSVSGNRMPVTTEIESLVTGAYEKLAHSDATGSDSDSNRYIAPDPTNGYESTHVFEFTIDEDPAEIHDIGILWEGYGDQCAQVELYAWDYVGGRWGDGGGLFGQNRFIDNWAGNRDGLVQGHIRSDFERYIDMDGRMTLLLYTERGPDGYYVTYNPSFHDYMVVTVSTFQPYPGDFDGDGDLDKFDFAHWDGCVTGPGNGPLDAGCDSFDFEDDDDVDMDDYLAFHVAYTGSL